ncbi:MAG: magnesium chelatase, partial [Clostridia bacterium]|nr:magnesium chelatase [Clostridia bacterium]
IMDRIDIHVEVDNISYSDLNKESKEENSATIKARVDKARGVQLERFKNTKTYSNAKMTVPQMKKFCKLSTECQQLMENAFSRLKLSARAHDRILRVARTIADLEGEKEILPQHIFEAISYRGLDRKYWD